MISVSEELKEIIDAAKDKEGHTSLDSVIRAWKIESDAYRMMKPKK
jgi:hypothetical protein